MAILISIRKPLFYSESSLHLLPVINKRSFRLRYVPKQTLLTYEEAMGFLQNKIHIKDASKKLKKNRLDLLKEITNNFNRYIPFHNLTALSVPPKERRLPDFAKIRTSGLQGEGGLCYPQAIFTNWLLTTLGYNSFLVASKLGTVDRNFTHVTTLAKDVVKKGDLYLVEVGSGFPTFEPVPLHTLPRTFKHSFLVYKFIRRGKEYFRLHPVWENFNTSPTSTTEEGWQTFYHFQAIPRDEDFLGQHLEKIYTEPGYAAEWHLMGLKMSIYPDGKAVIVNDRTLCIWDETLKTKKIRELRNAKDMKEVIEEHFPVLKTVDIEDVLKHWKTEADAWELKKKQKKAK